jgi:thiamine-phosphate pyrophosphorylase
MAGDRLIGTAIALGLRQARRKPGSRLPSLWLVTDPARSPDAVAAAMRLPRGAGLIYRAFGAPDALQTAKALRRIAWARGLVFLVGADARLAAKAKADGVHLPDRAARKAIRLRRLHPGWRITAAAHDRAALVRAGRFSLDAALVSVVFASGSPSARALLGPIRFASLIRGARTPVIALGGINKKTAPRLIGTGAAGLAAVEGLVPRT